ncbi:MAG: glycerate kinase [Naasia sp.]
MAVVLIAPDSFKGTVSAVHAARAIADGWRSERPGDELLLLPMADGGEGTLEALAAARRDAVWHRVDVDPPAPGERPVRGRWLELPRSVGGQLGVVELAEMAGLPLLDVPAPLTAHTRGLGQAIRAALAAGVDELWVALGGSASTDGGAGALQALGARILTMSGDPIGPGGGALTSVRTVDLSALPPLPAGGVSLLTDVTAPLLGSEGAAAVFGPQKGATPEDIVRLDGGLGLWAAALGGDVDEPGAGAAGGTAFGLRAWGARIVAGAPAVADALGISSLARTVDVVVTGEGRFDAQSTTGKGPGHVLDLAQQGTATRILIAGDIIGDVDAERLSLTDLAGGSGPAKQDATHWLRVAGTRAASVPTLSGRRPIDQR